MQRIILYSLTILILLLNNGCKSIIQISSENGLNRLVKMPYKSEFASEELVKKKYSIGFTHNNDSLLTFKNNILLRDSILLGFNIFYIDKIMFKDDNERKERKEGLIGVTRWKSDKLSHFEQSINDYVFFIIIYENRLNTNYTYAKFESEMTKTIQYNGTIRFPKNYSFKQIKRKCLSILSDISSGEK